MANLLECILVRLDYLVTFDQSIIHEQLDEICL